MNWKSSLSIVAMFAVASCGGDDGNNGDNGADGANGYVSLLKTTTVAQGDSSCPAGGTRLDTGLDNGDGGGTAGDNTLQDGEIDATSYVCNGATGNTVDDFALPDGAAGTFFVNTKGGNGTGAASNGGNGGEIDVYHEYGTDGGHVKIAKTGLVDASFTIPAAPATSNYGTNPLVVASGTQRVKRAATITDASDLDGNALAAGDIVLPDNSYCGFTYNLYRWNSTSSADIITGIHVQAGATLAFDHNGDCDLASTSVTSAIRNEGTITTGHDTTTGDTDSLELHAASFFGAAGSTLSTKGAAGTSGNAGYLYVYVELDDSEGSLWNFGTADTSGADGENGGNGNDIYFWGYNQMINTGAITAKGGNASAAAGTAGSGGTVRIESGYGVGVNTATLDVSGGNGGATGGSGGTISVAASYYGDLYSSGELRSLGGTPGDACATTCQGGNGGEIYIYAGGDVHHSANASSYGADGKTGHGGNGGGLYVVSYYDYSLQTDYPNSGRGSLFVSGNFDAHGGDGTTGGGNGSGVYIYTDLYYTPFAQQIAMYGYGGGFDSSGGSGTAAGGNAGELSVTQEYGYNYSGEYVPGGAIISSVDMTAKGGDSSSGAGGSGAPLWFYTNEESYGHTGFERAINTGTWNISGGSGVTSGGNAGYVYMYGLDGAENAGSITANAGSASAGNGGACDTYEWYDEGDHGIEIASDGGAVVNSGALSNNGGNGAGAGANGGSSGGILVFGYTTENSGALSANGGNGDTASGTGGNGGTISVRASSGTSVNTAPSMTASGGTGSTGNAGTAGAILVDGQLQ